MKNCPNAFFTALKLSPFNKLPLKKLPWGMMLKLLISGGLIAWIIPKMDIAKVWRLIQNLEKDILNLVLLLTGVTLAAVSRRWQLITRLKESTDSFPLPLPPLMKATFIGAFFNQFLPSSVGGDFYRVLAVRRFGIPLNEALSGVIIDRLAGFISLGILCILALPAEGEALMQSELKWPFIFTLVLLAGVCGSGMLMPVMPQSIFQHAFLRPFLPALDMIRQLIRQKTLFIKILLVSLAAGVLLVSTLQVLMMAFKIPLTWGQSAAILPAVLLLTSLPISFAGWGLREGAMILALGVYGIPQETALALSVVYGVINMASGLPGLILWIMDRRQARAKVL